MRKVLGYILIFCFIVIAVPKTVLHDHHEELIALDGDSFSQDHEDCFSCDFDYTSLSANIGVSLSAKIFFLEEYLNDRLLDGNSSFSFDFKSRGPPYVDYIQSA